MYGVSIVLWSRQMVETHRPKIVHCAENKKDPCSGTGWLTTVIITFVGKKLYRLLALLFSCVRIVCFVGFNYRYRISLEASSIQLYFGSGTMDVRVVLSFGVLICLRVLCTCVKEGMKKGNFFLKVVLRTKIREEIGENLFILDYCWENNHILY